MFNLIMRSGDWNSCLKTMPLSRVFEYTESQVSALFKTGSNINLDQLIKMPCLFMGEGICEEIAHVGQINGAKIVGNDISFEYTFDPEVPTLTNKIIYSKKLSFDISDDFEFSRNHWAVKDVDLYKNLLRNIRPRRQHPNVFHIPEHENIEDVLVSVMMPLDTCFCSVYQSIQQAVEGLGLRCRRADDIWENPAIIQDIVSLIDRSRIVVCDCTGRNPNVFYEAGIAHTLGREIILITQNEADVPFDLRHLRHVRYLNNGEGLKDLGDKLHERMQTILGH